MIVFFVLVRRKGTWEETFFVGIGTMLGTWFPDWDLGFGIGFHRNPFFHSAFFPFLAWLWYRRANSRWIGPILAGFALGVSSHLFWDTIHYGDVRWIPGASNDRIFLLINAIVGAGIAWWIRRSYTKFGREKTMPPLPD